MYTFGQLTYYVSGWGQSVEGDRGIFRKTIIFYFSVSECLREGCGGGIPNFIGGKHFIDTLAKIAKGGV